MELRTVEGAALYALLRALTSPIVAITTSAGGRRNGMIANSAQRASLVTSLPRVSIYISKTNFTHDLVYASGVLGLHLLRADQWEVVRILGLESGRDREKLEPVDAASELPPSGERREGRGERVPVRIGKTGCPLLTDCYAAFECRVANAMDAGAATFFLADVLRAEASPAGELLTSERFRAEIPEPMRRVYEARLAAAQQDLGRLAGVIERRPWPGPTAQP